jgi:hypothetical protein
MRVKEESDGNDLIKRLGKILWDLWGFMAENINFCLNVMESNRCSLTFRTSVLLPSSVPPLSLLA